MKKFKTIAMFMLLVLTCAGFAACSDDEDSSGDYASMIVGTWSDSGDDYWITFYPNGKYRESDGSGSYHGRYIINKNFLTLIEEDYGSGSYEDVYQIKSLSKTQLVLGEDEYEDWTLYRVD